MERLNHKIIERVFIIYHGVDPDGYFSGALLKNYFQEQFIKYREIRYNKKKNINAEQSILLFPGFYEYSEDTVNNIKGIFAQNTQGIHYNNILVITDFSFKMEPFLDLLQTCRENDCHEIIWFDHHERTINELQQNDLLADLNGTRNPKVAATRSVFDYVYDSNPVFYGRCEELINYVANYDIWNFNPFNTNDPVLHINNALEATLIGSFNEKVYKAEDLLKSLNKKNNQKEINELLDLGSKIQLYVNSQHSRGRSYIKKYRWRLNQWSPWLTLGVGNITTRVSLYFNHVIKDVDFILAWSLKEPNIMGSLRSYHKEDDSEYDVAELAAEFGGGGHKNASGFHMSRKEFNKKWLNKLHLVVDVK